MISPDTALNILSELRASELEGTAFRNLAMKLLDRLPSYDWSGIYRLEGDTLLLDEYVGAATDHTQIAVGIGVCGTAVAENRNQVISDVRELSNYLSCSVQTRAEIVVLIRRDDRILGQIDVDGHQTDAFDKTDEAFLEEMAEILAERW